jgi:site-specific recombinase XerC
MPAEELAPIAVAAVEAEDPLTAETLLTAWAREASPSPATVKKYGASFRSVARILKFDDVRRIRVDDVVTFKEARLAAGINPGTLADDIVACGAVCKWGVKNRKLTSNPFAGTAPKAPRRSTADDARAPYDMPRPRRS